MISNISIISIVSIITMAEGVRQPINFFLGDGESSNLFQNKNYKYDTNANYIIHQNDTLHTRNRDLERRSQDLETKVESQEEEIDNLENKLRYLKAELKNIFEQKEILSN